MRSPSNRRVLIVEDHKLLAQSLRLALSAEGFDVRIAPLSTPQRLISDVAASPPHLVLLDLDLGPHIGDGAALVPNLATETSVLVVTGVVDETRIAAAIEAGAVGYLSKSRPLEELVDAVVTVSAGGRVLSEDDRLRLLTSLRRRRLEEERRYELLMRLTPRETEVLVALADGLSVPVIARSWVVSEATVRTQVRAILTKLGVNSQLAAIALARRYGWLEPTRRMRPTTGSGPG